jgi:3-hydroxyisobutyrate dehydrogenase
MSAGTRPVAVLGLGAMGARIAAALLRAGHRVTVYNRSPAKTQALVAAGATSATSPRAAAQGAAFVLAMVRDDAASQDVWAHPETGALAGMAADALALDCSTLTPAWVQALDTRCAAQGRAFVHAPVMGSRPQADAGQLIFLAGGDPQLVQRAAPLFSAAGSAVHTTGNTPASAATMKLVANALFGIQVAALAELLALAHLAGLDPATALQVLGATPVASPAAKAAGAAMLAQADAPQFPIDLVLKDFKAVLATAAQAGCATPLASSAHQVFDGAAQAGWAGHNITAVARAYAV